MVEDRPRTATKKRNPRKYVRRSDPRSLRSRKLLRGALLRLIEERPFDRITQRDITAEAGVSYPTFFNHYDSKDDLFQDLARQEIVDLLTAFRENSLSPDWRPGVNMCDFIAERRSLWRTLLTAGASEVMRSAFIQRGRELTTEHEILGHGFPFDLISGVISGGIFEIIAWWLSQDDDYPVETISRMLESLVIEPALNLTPGHFTSRKGVPRTRSNAA